MYGSIIMVVCTRTIMITAFEVAGPLIIIIMAGMAVFYVAGYPIEERRRWPVITAFQRG